MIKELDKTPRPDYSTHESITFDELTHPFGRKTEKELAFIQKQLYEWLPFIQITARQSYDCQECARGVVCSEITLVAANIEFHPDAGPAEPNSLKYHVMVPLPKKETEV
jgi:hypothetical protein